MSSPSPRSHRRRSHSASSPIPHRQDDLKWRISVKRSRPNSIRSPSYKDLAHDQPTEKWDVDLWRRGKRARRSINAEDSSDEGGFHHAPFPAGDISALPSQGASTSASSPNNTCGFASTSTAFQFFPQRPQPRRRGPAPRGHPPRAEDDRISSDEARRLRASALSELHRSVAENGEGLVFRMRDWENAHLRAPRSPGSPSRRRHRPLTYHAAPQSAPAAIALSDEEDDDIFIVGETSLAGIARSPALKKRALSLSTMDVDLPEAQTLRFPGAGGGERGSSPVCGFSARSAYSSDDEGHADMDTDLSSSIYSTPAMSHTYSVSANSSLVSLPLPHQGSEGGNGVGGIVPASESALTVVSGGTPSTPPRTASRAEKAIAALTLAMANGAAGISDYDVLRTTEGLTTLDESHAGELWN